LNDSDLRYRFSCPTCSGSFSIALAKIPPVQARFSCPKCGKPMDFPSREEARVYISLQEAGGAATPSVPGPEPAPAPKPAPAAVAPPAPPKAATHDPASGDSTATAEKAYRVEKTGFENDTFDRRAMRNLIRSGGLLESDAVGAGTDPARPASEFPELKSLFDLKKTSRIHPPTVCRKHTSELAHYACAGTGRPLCEACAEEKKYGGTSVRVCEHCGGTVDELPVAEDR
jgi:predicted Zn finger-like uncharacterized protein